MKYDPQRHHRHSIRLKGYDYSQSGAYFITAVTQNRACLFGQINGDAMRLNDAGAMIERWWNELNHKFPTVSTEMFTVMPNHIHGILLIHESQDGHTHDGQTRRSAPTVGEIVQWFKTMTTNE